MKATKLTTLFGLMGSVALLACEQASPNPPVNIPQVVQQPPVNQPGPTNKPDEIKPERPTFTPVDVTLGPAVDISLMPEPVEVEPGVRSRRRMDIDQLDASLRRVTGGIGWTTNNVNQFTSLAATLGKPDFLTNTRESLEVSAMFEKFLSDAARSACFALMTRELAAAPANRIFLVHASEADTLADAPAKIEANLEAALMRFHGRSKAVLGGELEQWKWLYQSAEHISNDPATAWRTVCVGLVTHPDFYTY